MDLTGAPEYVQRFAGVSERQARDVLLRHRFLYYVAAQPEISDVHYDHLEWFFRYLFPHNRVIQGVGSSLGADYPIYIQEGRRPHEHERSFFQELFGEH